MYFSSQYSATFAASFNSNITKARPVIQANLDHSIVGDNFSGIFNLKIGSLDTVYDLNKQGNNNFLFNLYGQYKNTDNILSVGFVQLIGTEEYTNKLEMKTNQSFGIHLINNIKLNENKASETSYHNKYYAMGNSFLQNPFPFAISYVKSFLYDAFQVGVNYIPNINLNSSRLSANEVYKNKQALDLSSVYYSEYNDIGYGLTSSGRYYVKGSPSKTATHSTMEGALVGDLDYLGFSYRMGYSTGSNYFSDNSHVNFNTFNSSLFYNIAKYTAGISYLKSLVKRDTVTYDTKMLELNLNYALTDYVNIKTAFYDERLSSVKNNGVLIGSSITF